jgi:MFS transporter, DHA3 family, macrolide efflux protein
MTVLSNRSFTRIWSGQLVSQIGDKFYAIALAVWIVEKTGSPALMAALLIASTVPALIVGPFAGALVDRWNRKTVMIGADLVRGAVVTAVAILSAVGILAVWHVVAAAVAISVASAFFSPALSASLPGIVGDESLAEANSLSQLGGGITNVLGPACGAIVLGFLGYPAVYAVNAASFVVSGCLVALSRVPSSEGRTTRGRLTASVAEGARFVRQNRNVLAVLVVVMLVHFGVGGLSVALPFLAKTLNGSGARNLGYLEAFLGVGMVTGAIVLSRISKAARRGRLYGVLVSLGATLCAAGMLETAGVLSVIPFLACTAVIGAGIAAAAGAWTTVLQRETPDALRGRIFGISTTLGNASLPLGMALCGLLLDRVRFGMVFGPVGIVLIVTGILLGLVVTRSRQASRAYQGHSTP